MCTFAEKKWVTIDTGHFLTWKMGDSIKGYWWVRKSVARWSPKRASLPLPHHSKRNSSRRRIYTFATSGEHNSEFTTTIIYGELIIHTICNTTGKRGLLGHLVTWEKTAMSQYTFSKVSRQFKAQARIPVMKCCYKCWMLPVSYVEFNIVVHFNIS